MKIEQTHPLNIGIIGAGFSGTALAAALHRLNQPAHLYLFEKTGRFGLGDAYSTPYPFHLLNVRARDMSAFEEEPEHFVNWLKSRPDLHSDKTLPLADQFAPRQCYGQYLQDLLKGMQSDLTGQTKISFEPDEVIDVIQHDQQAAIILKEGKKINVDKVILALGNNPVSQFHFSIADDVNCIANPWDYTAPQQIPNEDPVLIVGTGLSMIDTVLTLHHQQHRGKIYAVSRRGLMPLPHADNQVPFFMMPEQLPQKLRLLTKYLRDHSQLHIEAGGDWRSVINALRLHIPTLWPKLHLQEKKRFLRHALPYWNIHRHRVHNKIAEFLAQLSAQSQLMILAGRIISVDNTSAKIKLRQSNKIQDLAVKWVINCMGPSHDLTNSGPPLLQTLLQRGTSSLDALNMGVLTDPSGALKTAAHEVSSKFYTLGPSRKNDYWESGAVPEIRKQCSALAKHLLNKN